MTGAIDGIRVVEVEEGTTLAHAGKLLRDLGAEVIKIEPPGGDAVRTHGPFPSDEPDPAHSGMFIFLNGGKQGNRLDLETAEGRAGLVSLVAGADVLLHCFQPAAAKRLGLASRTPSTRRAARRAGAHTIQDSMVASARE